LKVPIHPQGWRFIAIAAALNLLGFAVALWLGLVLLPVTAWVVAFFRDPERTAPAGANLVLSPADGKLLPIVKAVPPEELGLGPEPRVRLAIFMSVFNVHVNRAPCGGSVTGLAYRPGKFFNASFDKASHYNERMSILIRMDDAVGSPSLAVVQMRDWWRGGSFAICNKDRSYVAAIVLESSVSEADSRSICRTARACWRKKAGR